MIKPLGIGWTVWKVTSKRLGPAGGFAMAIIAVAGYLFLNRWLNSE